MAAEFSFTALRIAFGLMMSLINGFAYLPPDTNFIGMVRTLGFPAAEIFAWMALLSEFIGGLLVAAGLMTRPASLLIAFTMMTAVFGQHAKDPWSAKQLPFIYLLLAILFTCRGAGGFSVDHYFR